MSWLPPVPYSVSQKTASKSPRQGNQIIVEGWHMVAVGWWAPKSEPFLNPHARLSQTVLSFKAITPYDVTMGIPRVQPMCFPSWVSFLSHTPAALFCSCLCALLWQPMLKEAPLWFFYNWTGPFVIDQNIAARFQKSKPSKWHALPCKYLLWSQSLPRGPGMVPYVSNQTLEYKVKYI